MEYLAFSFASLHLAWSAVLLFLSVFYIAKSPFLVSTIINDAFDMYLSPLSCTYDDYDRRYLSGN